MAFQRIRVKIPHQLIGSGEHLSEMHPEQYFLDEMGDLIYCLYARGMTPEDIAKHVSKYEPDFPVSRVNMFITLADRKVLWLLTGEVNRNKTEVTKKLARLREKKFKL
jgi:hypothetical protein